MVDDRVANDVARYFSFVPPLLCLINRIDSSYGVRRVVEYLLWQIVDRADLIYDPERHKGCTTVTGGIDLRPITG